VAAAEKNSGLKSMSELEMLIMQESVEGGISLSMQQVRDITDEQQRELY
jgi:hypothetical protein